jgi:hypothetical protein
MLAPPRIPKIVKHGDWIPLLLALGLTALSWFSVAGLRDALPFREILGTGIKGIFQVAMFAPGAILAWIFNGLAGLCAQGLHAVISGVFENYDGGYFMNSATIVLAQFVFNYVFVKRARSRSIVALGIAYYIGLFLLCLPVAYILLALSFSGK